MAGRGSLTPVLDFLSGGGEMGTLIREFDWSRHPLGNPDSWPQSLKTAVSLILNSQHPMWIGWGRDVSFLYNDAYLHVLGLSKHPWALGRPTREVWAEIWETIGPMIEKVFRDGEASFVDDMRLFMSRGDYLEEVFYSFSYSPIRDESGGVGGLFCPSNDVTMKVLSTRRLRTLSELSGNALVEKTTAAACASAAATLEKNPDDVPFAAVYLVEEARAVLQENVRLKRGVPRLTPLLVDLDDPGDLTWPLAEVFSTGTSRRVAISAWHEFPLGPANQPVTEAVVLPVVAGGHEKPIGALIAGMNPTRRVDPAYETFLALVADQVGQAIVNARAVEEERRRAEALAELDRAKTAFFSNVSHEFRTPLTLMMGPLERVLAGGALQGEEREQIEAAHRNSLRLLKLVNSLLDFSRIEAGRMKAAYGPADLARMTAELASNFRSTMEAAGLKLIVDCPPLSEPVYVDREMWEKVVLNLLSNAFKFTFEGQVTVRLQEEDGSAVLTVADTGVGIPDREIARIFERFHRVEGVTGRTYEGTGIGLALIQELVKLHGGSVSVTSRFGEGSEFRVAIPLGRSHLAEDRIEAAPPDVSATARIDAFRSEAASWIGHVEAQRPETDRKVSRILLADDNADMRDYVSRILGADYDVTAVADGAAALRAARKKRPELVVSDVMMPVLDGFGLLRELRSDPELRDVPVILLSARAGEEARTEGISAGADDYLTKPFSARELLARVQTTVELQRIRREAREEVENVSARLQSALTASRLVAWEWDLLTDVIVLSENATEMIGVERRGPAEALWATVHPEDIASARAAVQDAIEHAKDYTSQFRVRRPDTGALLWMEVHGHVMCDPAGNRTKMAGVLLDVTERRRIGALIQGQKEALERAVGGASLDEVLRVLARTAQTQSDARAVIAVSDPPIRVATSDLSDPDEGDARFSQPIYTKGGEILGNIALFTSTEPGPAELDALGYIAQTAAVLIERDREAEAKRLAREELLRSEERFRTMANQAPVLIWMAGRDMLRNWFNDPWLKFTGRTMQQELGWGWMENIHSEDRERVTALYKDAFETRSDYSKEYRLRRYDGEWRWILAHAVPLYTDGMFTGYIGSSIDITEMKNAEEELRRANQDLEQFAYSASHDLQEPLRTVKIYGELLTLRHRDKLEGQALEFLDFIRTGASRMEVLVRDLLAYTQAARQDKFAGVSDAGDALRASLENLGVMLMETGASIDYGSLPTVPVRSTHLQQLFQNLISNAIKYRRPDVAPVVCVRATRQNDTWLFEVKDNGIGIDMQYKDRIFGIFKRLHTSDDYSGTGIGLAICKRIVDRYHGRIWVESEPGKGSRFYFTLPA